MKKDLWGQVFPEIEKLMMNTYFHYKADTGDKSIKGSGVKVWPLSHFIYDGISLVLPGETRVPPDWAKTERLN